MGKKWDKLTGADATQRSQEILKTKYPADRGLSPETTEEVKDGKLEIVDDDPQAGKLQEIAESP